MIRIRHLTLALLVSIGGTSAAHAELVTLRYKGVVITGPSTGAPIEGIVRFPAQEPDLIAGPFEDWWQAPGFVYFTMVGAGIDLIATSGSSELRIKDTPVEDALRYDGVSGSTSLLLLLSGGDSDALLAGSGGLTGTVPTGVADPSLFVPCAQMPGGAGFGGSCSQFATSQGAFLFQLTDFSISPPDVRELLSSLVSSVIGLNLQKGISNSFDAKLTAAMAALDDDNDRNNGAAVNAMQAFINAVEAQRADRLDAAEADTLISQARRIIAVIQAQ